VSLTIKSLGKIVGMELLQLIKETYNLHFVKIIIPISRTQILKYNKN